MQKLISKISSLSIAILICFISVTNVFAVTYNNEDSLSYTSPPSLDKFSQLPELNINEKTLSESNDLLVRQNSSIIINAVDDFSCMSISELNQYIEDISKNKVSSKQGRLIAPQATVTTVVELKLAWLAAAQVAKAKGYPCAAKAVEYSVLGMNYTEDKGAGGLFRDKIVKTSVYKNYLASFKKSGKTSVKEVKEFKKNDSADLFYALHNATITIKKSGAKYNVNVYDIFDFAFDNNYDSLFTSSVNNWAWLCQNTGVLNKVKININFPA